MSPAASPLIILPDEGVIDDESFELKLSGFKFKKPLTIIPWRSLVANDLLSEVPSLVPPEYRYATCLRWCWAAPDIKAMITEMGFKKVFCTSPTPSLHLPFEQIPYIDYVRPEIFSSLEKDILVSFVGWKGYGQNLVRNRIFELLSDVPSVIKRDEFQGEDLRNPERSKENQKQYEEILARSRFSLCPKGVGLGTIRFWESLKAGAIPIVISDGLTFPDCWDWKNTIIHVREWSLISHRLVLESAMSMTPQRESLMRENCLKAYDYLYNPKNIANYINNHL